jgi:hypothetical protein
MCPPNTKTGSTSQKNNHSKMGASKHLLVGTHSLMRPLVCLDAKGLCGRLGEASLPILSGHFDMARRCDAVFVPIVTGIGFRPSEFTLSTQQA